tara:strand:+ start:252 stop:1163 length:912 start_codon:yes stop_codon:yes gene_type:complete
VNENTPLVTVVVPVFNAERYIYKALKSVCEQTYTNLEIIVLDDGSSDGTRRIIESIDDVRIKLISRENRGLIATLNEGVTASKGTYIARMDADDICLPDRFARQVEFFQNNKGFGVLFTGIEYIDASDDIIRKKIAHETRTIKSVELIFGCPLCHPTAMFNMSELTKSDLRYDLEFDKTEDFELWTRLILKTEIALLGDVLFQYRIHSDSITSNNNVEQRKTALRAIERNLSEIKSNKVIRSLGVIYNNHQGGDSFLRTLKAIFIVYINLNKINVGFSNHKFLSKSYYLLRNKLKRNSNISLR